jgi:transcriptional regulator with PAS, ATPase and Fis domain
MINNYEIENPFEIIGFSTSLKNVVSQLGYAARSKSNVLIQGESGTGKELIAQTIHYNSPRNGNPFITINVSAIPDTLLESELFGYEKGAFTGAGRTKPGKFEIANGGTIFLDEIGDMNYPLQAKILRAIQNRNIERLGGINTIPLDIRLIAATNKDLKQMAEEGTFRDDLFYRLNVVNILLMPLRMRKEDIPLLTEHFVKKYSLREGKIIEEIRPDIYNILMQYDWPGNIRELENVVERAVVVCDENLIDVEHLPSDLTENGKSAMYSSGSFYTRVEEFKKDLLITVLNETRYNKAMAARKLGMNRSHLFNLLKKFDLA